MSAVGLGDHLTVMFRDRMVALWQPQPPELSRLFAGHGSDKTGVRKDEERMGEREERRRVREK